MNGFQFLQHLQSRLWLWENNEFTFLRLVYACLRANRIPCSSAVWIEQWSLSGQERGLLGATDDTAVAANFSSTLEPSVKIWRWFWCCVVISKKILLIDFWVCTAFLKFCQWQTHLGFRLTPGRGVWHCDVINHTQVNLWILKQWWNMKAKRWSQLRL